MSEENEPPSMVEFILQAFPDDAWKEATLESWNKEKERQRNLRERLYSRLAELEVSQVRIEFDGSGDEGQFPSIETSMQGGRVAPNLDGAESDGLTLRAIIEDAVYGHLYARYGNWENNEGSSGTCVIDVVAQKMSNDIHVNEPSDEDDPDEGEDDDEEDEK